MAQQRRPYRGRKAEQSSDAGKKRKSMVFSPEHLTANLLSEYDVIIRLAPAWEMEFVFLLRNGMQPYGSEGGGAPVMVVTLFGWQGR